MKHAVFATAKNEDHVRKVVDHLRTLGLSTQDIIIIAPQATHGTAGQQPKKPGAPMDKPNQTTQAKGSIQFSNVSIRSLNIPSTDLKKFEDGLTTGLYVIAAQSDSNDKLEQVHNFFKKEGLLNIASNRVSAKTSH